MLLWWARGPRDLRKNSWTGSSNCRLAFQVSALLIATAHAFRVSTKIARELAQNCGKYGVRNAGQRHLIGYSHSVELVTA